jgi:hypothetical protein
MGGGRFVKITIVSAENLTGYNGAPVREWQGRTERGIACLVYVAGIAVPLESDHTQFEQELRKTAPPAEARKERGIDMRLLT